MEQKGRYGTIFFLPAPIETRKNNNNNLLSIVNEVNGIASAPKFD